MKTMEVTEPTGEEAAFWRAIRADPKEKTNRLVYADWLEEHDLQAEAQEQRVIAEPEKDEHRLAFADAVEVKRLVRCDVCRPNAPGVFRQGATGEDVGCGLCRGTGYKWIDGDPERAAFVRAEVALAGMEEPGPAEPTEPLNWVTMTDADGRTRQELLLNGCRECGTRGSGGLHVVCPYHAEKFTRDRAAGAIMFDRTPVEFTRGIRPNLLKWFVDPFFRREWVRDVVTDRGFLGGLFLGEEHESPRTDAGRFIIYKLKDLAAHTTLRKVSLAWLPHHVVNLDKQGRATSARHQGSFTEWPIEEVRKFVRQKNDKLRPNAQGTARALLKLEFPTLEIHFPGGSTLGD
jgi:uncharacterized protein (TIGR02996 family)